MSWTLDQRIELFDEVFVDLCNTNSRLEKLRIISTIPDELREDFDYILECLAGNIKFGYKYELMSADSGDKNSIPQTYTVKQCLEYLQEPLQNKDLSETNILKHMIRTQYYDWFFAPIVNRTIKLGIGRSLLPKDKTSAMLAKKYEGFVKYDDIYVTEKLDGNRCIAYYDGIEWQFVSRNGKQMHVKFDMSGLPQDLIYDGEVLSPEQTKLSIKIADGLFETTFDKMFNQTSGLINRHSLDKQLVYNIFDVINDDTYANRRGLLSELKPIGNVRILPVLRHYTTKEARDGNIDWLLDNVVRAGGEGLMINLANGTYEHKRTDVLLKYKQVQTVDMEVIGVEEGTGKYEGLVGALNVRCITDDGKAIACKLGSGLSDEQRMDWAFHPEKILGKIVEVAYFSISQNNSTYNTNSYSLRFPRLKKIRTDKNTTSIY